MKHFMAVIIIASIFCPRYMNSSECTGKMPKQRLPLFEHAEQCKEQLLYALELCQTQCNCPTDRLLAQATHNAHHCRKKLSDHLKTLEEKTTDDSCRMCEKNETREHHATLSELLTINEVQKVLFNFPLDAPKKSTVMPPFSH